MSSMYEKAASVISRIGPKLLPFIQTTCLYMVLYGNEVPKTPFACLIKCLPILSLALFVLLHGMNLTPPYSYSRRILTGLVFCCLGDACLVFNGYFELGMVFFAIGHICYCLAFGFRPVSLPMGLLILGSTAVSYPLIFRNVGQPLSAMGLVYTVIINMMVWRAIVRAHHVPSDLRTWMKICGCAGAISFCVSDLILGINKFQHPLPFADGAVMTTYYAGQLGIALSVVDSHKECTSEPEKSKDR